MTELCGRAGVRNSSSLPTLRQELLERGSSHRTREEIQRDGYCSGEDDRRSGKRDCSLP